MFGLRRPLSSCRSGGSLDPFLSLTLTYADSAPRRCPVRPDPIENPLRELKSPSIVRARCRCSPSVQERAKAEQTTLLFSKTCKHGISQVFSIHELTCARGYVFPGSFPQLPFQKVTTIPFRITSFAHHHPLTPIKSYSCKKQGGGLPLTPSRGRGASRLCATRRNASNSNPFMGLHHNWRTPGGGRPAFKGERSNSPRTAHGPRNAGHGTQVTGYGSRNGVTGHRTRITGHGSRLSTHYPPLTIHP